MASAISHAIVAVTLGQTLQRNLFNRRALLLGVLCSIVPDVDVIGFSFGVAYGDLWGHRGLTHSLFFAAFLSATIVTWLYRGKWKRETAAMGLYLFFCTASHGVLDALTDGGLGVAFFSPFDTSRYFFGARPILVSPIGIQEFFSAYGVRVMMSEAAWIWFPALAAFVLLRGAANRWP
jgi:inner membrane protein